MLVSEVVGQLSGQPFVEVVAAELGIAVAGANLDNAAH
jgi:hypothetical protein